VVLRATEDGCEFVVAICHSISGTEKSSQEDHRVPGKTPATKTAFKQAALRNILQQAQASAAARGQDCDIVALGDMNLTANALAEVVSDVWPEHEGASTAGHDKDFVLASCLSTNDLKEHIVSADNSHRAVSARVRRRSRPHPTPAATPATPARRPEAVDEPAAVRPRVELVSREAVLAASQGNAPGQSSSSLVPRQPAEPPASSTAGPAVTLREDDMRMVAAEARAQELAAALRARFATEAAERLAAAARQQAQEEEEIRAQQAQEEEIRAQQAQAEPGAASDSGAGGPAADDVDPDWGDNDDEADDGQADSGLAVVVTGDADEDDAADAAAGDRDNAAAATEDEDVVGSTVPAEPLAPPQGQETRFRREGVPCRAIVQRSGDLFTIASAQETTRNISRLLLYRLHAAHYWPVDEHGFLPKAGQLWALGLYHHEWRQERETLPLVEQAWRRQPHMDAFKRTMASYFKTTLFERCRPCLPQSLPSMPGTPDPQVSPTPAPGSIAWPPGSPAALARSKPGSAATSGQSF
jgi:hypothetical protein